MLTYGMESAALTDISKTQLDAFQAECLRKIHNIKSTYFTKIINPTAHTTTNEEVMKMAKQHTISQIIQRQQLKFLGHVLRVDFHKDPIPLEADICFTSAFVYRAGIPGDGWRRGQPREHWAEQAAQNAWELLTSQQHPCTANNKLNFPHCFLVLRSIALNREFWGKLTSLPTCIQAAPSQSLPDNSEEFNRL